MSHLLLDFWMLLRMLFWILLIFTFHKSFLLKYTALEHKFQNTRWSKSGQGKCRIVIAVFGCRIREFGLKCI